MKQKMFFKIGMITMLSFLVGIASFAVAQDSENNASETETADSRHYRMNMRGIERFNQNLGSGMGTANLTEEQVEQLKEARATFQEATQDLRMELKSKRLALQSELVKKEPDVKKAKTLQKEISALNAELAQLRIDQILEVKKIAPYGATGLKQLQERQEGALKGRQLWRRSL